MRVLSIFVIIAVLLITMISASKNPGLHKPYIIAPQNFKLQNFGQSPSDLQSVQMFKLGDAPVNVVSKDIPVTPVESQTAIIPSDINIIPSDFIQQVPPQGENSQANRPSGTPDNSDKVLGEVGKMIETDAEPKAAPNTKPNVKRNPENSNIGGCSICDALKDPKVRAELIAWNKWRSDIQNRIMETSEVSAPYGTIFYFTFNVDNQRRISKITIITRGNASDKDIQNIKSAILNLNNDKILEFPKGTKRKNVSFFGGFLISDVEQYSSPSDFKDFEYVQNAY